MNVWKKLRGRMAMGGEWLASKDALPHRVLRAGAPTASGSCVLAHV